MTTLLINVRDDSKVDDLVRFLTDIDFLDVTLEKDQSMLRRRRPAPELAATVICGDIVSPIVSEDDWDVLK